MISLRFCCWGDPWNYKCLSSKIWNNRFYWKVWALSTNVLCSFLQNPWKLMHENIAGHTGLTLFLIWYFSFHIRWQAMTLRQTSGVSELRQLSWRLVPPLIINIHQWKSWCWHCRTNHQIWTPMPRIRNSTRGTPKYSVRWSTSVCERNQTRGGYQSADWRILSTGLSINLLD